MTQADTVVVGGGLAGAASAILLARHGRPVTLFERDPGPRHKICGEFLSGEALAYLANVGVDAAALGASPIGQVRLVHGDSSLSAPLPFRGAGLSRRVLDEALLRQAEASGATVHRGAAVARIGGGVLEVGGQDLRPATILLATGKHDLRGAPRMPARDPAALIGFKMHFVLSPRQTEGLRGCVEVILFADGYAGLQLVEGGVANLCLLVDRARYDTVGRSWPDLLASLIGSSAHLARRLGDAAALFDRPLTIYRVPYGYVHAAPTSPGLFRLGDQAAVIPSFCGDGMSIALHSAHLAAGTLRRGGDAEQYHAQLRQDVEPAIRLAGWLYRGMRAPALRSVMLAACRQWPGLLRALTTRTRIPAAAQGAATQGAALQGTAPGQLC